MSVTASKVVRFGQVLPAVCYHSLTEHVGHILCMVSCVYILINKKAMAKKGKYVRATITNPVEILDSKLATISMNPHFIW